MIRLLLIVKCKCCRFCGSVARHGVHNGPRAAESPSECATSVVPIPYSIQFCEERAYQIRDLIDRFVESEVAGVKHMDLGIWDVARIGACSGHRK